MATFNIYGCCVSRDIFGFEENNTHEVKHFLQATSQIVDFIFPTLPKKKMTMEDMEGIELNNFKKRCIIKDYNKELFDYFEEKADFFIIDLIDIANTDIKKVIFEDGSEHYFTNSGWFRDAYRKGLSNFFGKNKIEDINRLQVLDKVGIDAILDGLINWLKGLGYTEEQIIVNEVKRARYYTDGNIVAPFRLDIQEHVNSIMDKIHYRFKQKCPKCHIIKMPFGTYSDERHPWKLTDLHYVQDHYNYLYKCVDIISKNPNCDDILADLWERQSNVNANKMVSYLSNNFDVYKGKNLLKNGDFTKLSSFVNEFIALKGSLIFNNLGEDIGKRLESAGKVNNIGLLYSQVAGDNSDIYVSSDDCIKGFTGDNVTFSQYWKTANKTTCVIVKDHSIIVAHNGIDARYQTNIIQTIDNLEQLYGKVVTLSAWARVLMPSDNNGVGGTIALINASDYNQGKCYARKVFKNTEWRKIELTTILPDKDELKGVTVCLRANTGVSKHSVVEFSQVKLELGRISTL